MIGKKRMKRRIAQFMGLAMAMGLMFSMNAMAGSSQEEVTLGGVLIRASSNVSDRLGYGHTSCVNNTPTVTVKINCTYTYIHPITGARGTYSSGWKEGQSSVSISYNPPDDYRSLSMQCEHEATNGAQNWSCHTEASIYQ